MKTIISLLLLAWLSVTALAAVIHVPADQPTIQTGINAATDGDTVLIAPGVYTGDGNRDISIESKNILVIGDGGWGSVTIDVQGDLHNGFELAYTQTTLRGLTVANAQLGVYTFGQAAIIDSCNLVGNQTGVGPRGTTIRSSRIADNGTGVFSDADIYANVINCVLEGNDTAIWGCFYAVNDTIRDGPAGIGSHGVGSPYSNFSASGCLFENLSSFAIHSGGLNIITDCSFRHCSGLIAQVGTDRRLEMTDCLVQDNPVGGIEVNYESGSEYASSLIMTRCVYTGNGLGISCSGLASLTGFMDLEECTIASNDGNGVYAHSFTGMNITVSRCLVAFNGGVGLHLDSNAVVNCCDVFGNSGGNYAGIGDQTGLADNISANPQFCGSSCAFCLYEESPCAPWTSPCDELIGTLSIDCWAGCCQARGDIDHNGAGPDIADLVYLVNYMFNGGGIPGCEDPWGSGHFAEADVNGSGAGPDIADLVYLLNYMFNGGPPPASCP